MGNTSFVADFKDCVLYTFGTEECERKWEIMVRKHKVKANEWVKKMYEDKHSWSEAYLKGYFFRGIRSTQRCEGFNGYLNQYVNRKQQLTYLVDQMARLMGRQREMESYDDYQSSNGKPSLTTHLREYE